MTNRKHKKSEEVLALRREVEALRAQLKDYAPTNSRPTKRALTTTRSKTSATVSLPEIDSNTPEYVLPQDNYLTKELSKTGIYSLGIIAIIIIIKALNLF